MWRAIPGLAGLAPLPGGLEAGLGLVEPTLHAGPLLLDDLVQPLPDVGKRVGELAFLEQLAAAVADPVEEVAQAAHVAARRIAGLDAAVHQVAQGLGQVAVLEQVVGERIDDLVRAQVRDLLRSVPGSIAGGAHERRVVGRARRPVGPVEVPGVGCQEGHRRVIRAISAGT